MPLLSAFLIAAWLSYTAVPAALSFDIVSPQDNLLTNGSFEEWTDATPTGWEVHAAGNSSHKIRQTDGFIDGHGFGVDVRDYQNGSVIIYSPSVSVAAQSSYFFKSFYFTNIATDLLVETTNTDGTKERELLRHYPDYDYPWSSMGSLIHTDADDVSVRIAIVLANNGSIDFDNAFVIKESAMPAQAVLGANLIANSEWTVTQSDQLTAFTSIVDNRTVVNVTDHRRGNAAWIPTATDVQQHELYHFSASYRSDTIVEIGVDYEFADGSYAYHYIQELQPLHELTHVTIPLEVPAGAVRMQPSIQITDNGTLEATDYALTKQKDAATFDAPRISITFDDGWLSSHTNGTRVLDEFGYSGTYYINPSVINTPNFMTSDILRDLLEGGHQIGSHTNTHIDLTSFSLSSVAHELDTANSAIRDLGISDIDFASPYGKHDQRVLPEVMDRSLTHRGTDVGVNTKQNFDADNLKGLFIRRDTTDRELRDMIRQAQESNGWLILIYHQVESTNNPFTVDEDTFRRHMQIVAESGIDVQTVRQSMQSLQN